MIRSLPLSLVALVAALPAMVLSAGPPDGMYQIMTNPTPPQPALYLNLASSQGDATFDLLLGLDTCHKWAVSTPFGATNPTWRAIECADWETRLGYADSHVGTRIRSAREEDNEYFEIYDGDSPGTHKILSYSSTDVAVGPGDAGLDFITSPAQFVPRAQAPSLRFIPAP